ncbi:MAG: rRNA adenine N-6-methyltransferase family protein [Lachnospiraceae bacterium]
MREKIGKITLDDTCYSGSDLYSDGPVEEELLEIAKSCHTPEEYNQVIAERKSWPVMYHFSHIRGNIVSWLPITKEDKVLEIGAGCGAITGALAKKAGSVTCVELSRQRSLVNAYRNEDCDNVTILLGAFEEVWKRRWRRSTITSPSSASSSMRPAIRTTRIPLVICFSWWSAIWLRAERSSLPSRTVWA